MIYYLCILSTYKMLSSAAQLSALALSRPKSDDSLLREHQVIYRRRRHSDGFVAQAKLQTIKWQTIPKGLWQNAVNLVPSASASVPKFVERLPLLTPPCLDFTSLTISFTSSTSWSSGTISKGFPASLTGVETILDSRFVEETALLHWDLDMTLINALQPSTKGNGRRRSCDAEVGVLNDASLEGIEMVGR